MGMKKKIAQAFTQDTPDILESILRDCPEKEREAAGRKRRWVLRYAAMAAAVALVLASAWSTVLLIREQAVNGFWQQGPGVPTDDALGATDGTADKQNEPAVPTKEEMITRTDHIIYPLELRNSIYQVPDVEVTPVTQDGEEFYEIIRTASTGYCYRFLFTVSTGSLYSIEVLPCECEKTGAISKYLAGWIAMLNEDRAYFGNEWNPQFKTEQTDMGNYLVTFYHDRHYAVLVDSFTGQIRDIGMPVGIRSAKEARDIALEANGVTLEALSALKISITEQAEYLVRYEVDGTAFTVTVDPSTGTPLEILKSEGVKPERLEGTIGWEQARAICLNAAEESLGAMTGFVWSVSDDSQVIHVEMQFEDSAISVSLDAVTGVRLDQSQIDYPPLLPTTQQIRDLALEHCGVSLDDVAILKMGADGVNYGIYFDAGDVAFQVLVHSITGAILEVDEVEAGVYAQDSEYFGWKNVRDNCLAAIHRELDDLVGITWDISANPLVYWMELYFDDGDSFHAEVDAKTGQLLTDQADDPPMPEPDAADLLAARDLALSMAGITLKDAREWDVLDNGSVITVTFETGEYAHRFDIDTLTGEILYDHGADHVGWRADEKMEHLIGRQRALKIALEACGRDISEVLTFFCGYWYDSYFLSLRFAEDEFQYRIDALDGKLLDFDIDPPNISVDTDKAVALALKYVGLTLEDVTDLAVKLAEPPEMSTVPTYWVYFQHGGISYEISVNGSTGEVIPSGALPKA